MYFFTRRRILNNSSYFYPHILIAALFGCGNVADGAWDAPSREGTTVQEMRWCSDVWSVWFVLLTHPPAAPPPVISGGRQSSLHHRMWLCVFCKGWTIKTFQVMTPLPPYHWRSKCCVLRECNAISVVYLNSPVTKKGSSSPKQDKNQSVGRPWCQTLAVIFASKSQPLLTQGCCCYFHSHTTAGCSVWAPGLSSAIMLTCPDLALRGLANNEATWNPKNNHVDLLGCRRSLILTSLSCVTWLMPAVILKKQKTLRNEPWRPNKGCNP